MLRYIVTTPAVHNKWLRFYESRTLTLAPDTIVHRDDGIFTMGSCFAREIRFALRDLGMNVGPDLSSIPVEEENYSIDQLPNEQHLNYYNSFTIRQEFERIAGIWTQSPDDYWELGRRLIKPGLRFQDPYKRMTFGRTPKELFKAIDLTNAALERSARTSRVFFFTFGMAEVFRSTNSGRVVGQKPGYSGGGGSNETEFVQSRFAENFENLVEIRNIVKSLNPEAHIVATVSPVPLQRTFSGKDIVAANMQGKSTLHAAVTQFCDTYEDVTYFPSYEIVTMGGEGAFQERDLRHVKEDLVKTIMATFVNTHVSQVGSD